MVAKRHTNGHGVLWMHRSYNNIEKHPDIDKFRTIYQRVHIKEDDLAAVAGLSTSTVKNMFGGKTKDPRASTFQKLATSFGYEYGLQQVKEINYDKEIPKAKEQRKAYYEKLHKPKRKRS